MKKIEAIVRPFKLDEMKARLTETNVRGMTYIEVRGFGRQQGRRDTYRGTEYSVDFSPKAKLEVVCEDADVQHVVDAILEVSQSGRAGDGKIFVSDLADAVHIRSGESGENAL